jgi:hypothetical protein
LGRGGIGAAALAAAALAAAVGCGEDGGVTAGATVRAYVAAPLCASAERELARAGGGAAELRVRSVCLDDPRRGARLSIATVGANARRATEDATAIAYLEAPDPAVAKFTHPILESADVGWTTSRSGATAMRRVLSAIAEADSGTLRDAVRESLEAG